jgi:hypothetical protein
MGFMRFTVPRYRQRSWFVSASMRVSLGLTLCAPESEMLCVTGQGWARMPSTDR